MIFNKCYLNSSNTSINGGEMMIYTITFNPSLDYVMQVADFKEGKTNRSVCEEIYPGGKGFNVSMVLNNLGIKNIAMGFVAGFTGLEIERLLKLRNLDMDLCYLQEGMSRINVKMKGVQETEINGNGPIISENELNEMLFKLDHLKDEDILILAGSIPTSLPNDIYEQILKRLNNKQIKVIVDASGDLLIKVLPYHPFLIKPNHQELEDIFKTKITSQKDIVHYAKILQKMGAQNVLISLGENGAILLSSDHHVYRCNSAKGKLINSVGSGDSMVAGFLAGYLKQDYQEALLMGSACGGATAFSKDLGSKQSIEDIYQKLKVIVIE